MIPTFSVVATYKTSPRPRSRPPASIHLIASRIKLCDFLTELLHLVSKRSHLSSLVASTEDIPDRGNNDSTTAFANSSLLFFIVARILWTVFGRRHNIRKKLLSHQWGYVAERKRKKHCEVSLYVYVISCHKITGYIQHFGILDLLDGGDCQGKERVLFTPRLRATLEIAADSFRLVDTCWNSRTATTWCKQYTLCLDILKTNSVESITLNSTIVLF